MCSLLEKEIKFVFDEQCIQAFEALKKKLIEAPIPTSPNWELPFELMCDASDVAVGAVLGKRKEREFDIEIKDQRGYENHIADHLSRLESSSHVGEQGQIREHFFDEKLLALEETQLPWYANIVNYLVIGLFPLGATTHQKKRLIHDARFYIWNEPYLFKQGPEQRMRRCVLESEMRQVMDSFHSSTYEGHHGGINFMGPFPTSNGNQYILVVVDYVSKWVEAAILPTNDAKVVLKFLKKHIFTRFGTPREIISDGGTHFINQLVKNVLAKYGVRQKVAISYHPQNSGQVELSNREVK
ncbi:uncharacterized protein [Solanum tuberosum]|uniref:uncharacterized protein n=1 Tax=Solanum tuberosum TaxID=4113 RepID=UPI00073A3D22|nr:PREDICTED: uncharacterized protein LOC107062972 [Solanum tuberosum]